MIAFVGIPSRLRHRGVEARREIGRPNCLIADRFCVFSRRKVKAPPLPTYDDDGPRLPRLWRGDA